MVRHFEYTEQISVSFGVIPALAESGRNIRDFSRCVLESFSSQ